ncbi:MAG: hypothetical protein DRP62_06180 [Planctomycetota bacterium]|nr:MAG: hypothetical protein DRP62_06180 [Planctomycetota bacterium]
MKHKGLHVSKIYQNQNLSGAAETISGVPVRFANTVHTGFEPLSVPCMIWETLLPADHVILFSPIRHTAVQNATITSTLTWTIWLYPGAVIHTVLSQWRYDWLSKMDYRIVRHRGIYGETIEYLYRGRQFRIGLKQRGKKSEAAITTDYIDYYLITFDFRGLNLLNDLSYL